MITESTTGINLVKCNHQLWRHFMVNRLKGEVWCEDMDRPVWGSTEKMSWPWVMAYTRRALFPYVGSSASLAVTWIMDVPVKKERAQCRWWVNEHFQIKLIKYSGSWAIRQGLVPQILYPGSCPVAVISAYPPTGIYDKLSWIYPLNIRYLNM